MSPDDTLSPDESQSGTAPDKRYIGLQRVLSNRDRELAQAKAELQRLQAIAEEAAIYRDLYFSNESDSAPVEQPDPAQDEPVARIDPNNPRRNPLAKEPTRSDLLDEIKREVSSGIFSPRR